MKTSEICQNEWRREKSRASNLNGLDYVEVSEDQRILTIYFLGKAPERICGANIRIEGGRRVRDLKVIDVEVNRVDDPELDDSMDVTVDRPGDFSNYTLRLENDPKNREDRLLEQFDPRYAELDFSFKAACPSDLDCQAQPACPPVIRDEPDINYLAKDYASFRQLMLDRLALLLPDWRERHPPDLGITLVEVLAYVGDHLSYYQDAVGTEAYLATARQRISVRRHARLVDYFVHEGCNARAWVCINTSIEMLELDAADIFFTTSINNGRSADGHGLKAEDLRNIPAAQYEVFEPLLPGPKAKLSFRQAHNSIPFYTWGDRECCLPRGSTSATLRDDWDTPTTAPNPSQTRYPAHDKCDDVPPKDKNGKLGRKLKLKVGDVLIFEEVIGPKTGNPADANPSRRYPVRLTKVEPGVDALYNQPIVHIEWAEEDALPFPFCLSVIGPPSECELLEGISVARGNVVLVDHGLRIEVDPKELDPVPTEQTAVVCEGECRPSESTVIPGKYRPSLQRAPLTFAQPMPPESDRKASARQLIPQDVRLALPQVWLEAAASGQTGTTWSPRGDLLSSGADDQQFVVEMDNDGRAHLRFGDGELGRMPDAGTVFKAHYRIGNGPAGNVGPESITQVIWRKLSLDGGTLTARNPLPAHGGTAPEPAAEVKLYAPHTFRKELQRAITADDYAQIVMREFADQVQRATAVLRWNGSWYEVQVAIDPKGTEEAPPGLFKAIESVLQRYRRIGHDLRIVAAHYVPLHIALEVCVQPHHLRGHVKAALLEIFSSGLRSDGQPGFFHPDNVTFGDGVYLSRLVAEAQWVTGVESVDVTKLERLFAGPNHEIENGLLPLGSLEVARVDNDPGNPENGILTIQVRGGR